MGITSRRKIIILLSIALLVSGYTWSLDTPLALEVPLRQPPYNFSSLDFNLIYFSTYIAICFSDMPVGMLLDKFPIKRTILITCIISLIAQFCILLMFYFQFIGYKIFIFILRGIFGITGQALFTIQALLISLYGGKYYDRLIGVAICTPYFFDSINNIVTPFIYSETESMELVWIVGVVFCLIALLSAVVIAKLVTIEEELQKSKKQGRQNNDKNDLQQKLQNKDQSNLQGQQKNHNKNLILSLSSQSSRQSSQSFSQEKLICSNSQLISPNSQEIQNQSSPIKQQQQSHESQINFNGLKSMPRQFWIITAAVFVTQYSMGSYIDNLNDFIVKRFQISYVNAGYLMIIPYGAGALMSFILGLVLQKRPKLRRILILSSSIIFSLGLIIVWIFPNIQPHQQTSPIYYFVISIQFLSVSYLLAVQNGVLSSAIVYVVQPRYLGIAWGVIGSAIGSSQAIGPLIVAVVLDTEEQLSNGYKKLALYIFFSSMMALGFSLWIYFGDFKRIDVNSTSQQQKNNIKDGKKNLNNNLSLHDAVSQQQRSHLQQQNQNYQISRKKHSHQRNLTSTEHLTQSLITTSYQTQQQ